MIPCHVSVVSANIPAKECQTLIKSLPYDCQKTGNLMKSLTVFVGINCCYDSKRSCRRWFTKMALVVW